MLKWCNYIETIPRADAFSWEWRSLQCVYSEHIGRLARSFQTAGTWVEVEHHPQSHRSIWGYFEVSIFILDDAHCSASEFVCPWWVWTHLRPPGQPCQDKFPPNPLLLLHSTRLTAALLSPWPVCSWGRFGAKTFALLGTECEEIAFNSLSSHFPWDKLLSVVLLYIWLHSADAVVSTCQWSLFLSFTVLSVMKFASFANSIFRFS